MLPYPYHSFGPRLRQLRENAGLSRRTVADSLGISYPLVSHWENGYQLPAQRHRSHLAALYGVNTLSFPKRRPEPDPIEGMSLAAVRQRAGFTQCDAARAIGIDQSRLCYWERGKIRPSLEGLAALAALYVVQPEEIDLPPGSLSKDLILDGARLRAARKGRGWTRMELAARLDMAENTIAKWENQLRQRPHRKTWAKLVETLGVTVEDLALPPETQ
jgi:transcriptional regulator with XRE-family HTH domain